MHAETPIRAFFEQYARGRNARDVELIASQYSDQFMFADPNGARVVQKPALLATFPKGLEHLKTHGHTSTQLASLDEARLDEHYVLVRAKFVWRFEQSSEPPIDVAVDSTFILYVNEAALTIVFQQEREDFQEALRSHGISQLKP